jgi:hypothetical protein
VNERRCFPIVYRRGFMRRVTDGARSRHLLLCHNPMPPVTVRPAAYGFSAYLRGFRRLGGSALSATTSLY